MIEDLVKLAEIAADHRRMITIIKQYLATRGFGLWSGGREFTLTKDNEHKGEKHIITSKDGSEVIEKAFALLVKEDHDNASRLQQVSENLED